MAFSSEFIGQALNKRVQLSAAAKRISADSRSFHAGDLFAAIRGETFDGHQFISEAAAKGGVGAIIDRDLPTDLKLPSSFSLIQVEDVTLALRQLAAAHRVRLKTKLFAVGGSNGKTTTKEWISFLLEKLDGPNQVFKTKKSENSVLGIALSLLQIREERWGVIEIGIDEPGWMDQHLSVVQPDAGLLTMITEEHLAKLISIEVVAEEELKLLHHLKDREKPFAVNQDDSRIAAFPSAPNSLTYGLKRPAMIEGSYVKPQSLHAFGCTWKQALPGVHNAQNLLAALTAVRILKPDLKMDELRALSQSTGEFQGEAHRSLWLQFPQSIQVYDDCYNANPESMEAALRTFLEVSDGCRQKAIWGDMRELGAQSQKAHQRLLNLAAVVNMDEVFLFGPEFARAYNTLEKSLALSQTKFRVCEEWSDLESAVKKSLSPADTFLVKGSRGMKMERILDLFSTFCKE
jgi:UDP-N-acetylmuramoyl-tripeptide--D-alanyl-D-alanine ligase